ncbi:MAG: sulfotransferase [Bacteroidota bacterium]
MHNSYFITQLFRLRKGSMRVWHGRRILVVMLVLPLFGCCLLVNRLALLLDRLLFPSFRRQAVNEPVFIVAPPRSGTAYLFRALAEAGETYTCLRLWEIVFAPAICQKYLLLALRRWDRRVGSPLKKWIVRFEDRYLAKLRGIRPLGLGSPEEDEAILLWYLGSGLLHHFYPDARFLDDLLYFDGGGKNPAREARTLRRYRACVQRHNYVFNRDGERSFLARNPFFMNRLGSLRTVFPDARVVTISREPIRSLASTLSLNTFLYRLASARRVPQGGGVRSLDLLLCWYALTERALRDCFPGRHLRLDFAGLMAREPAVWGGLAGFLGLETCVLPPAVMTRTERSRQTYPSLVGRELARVRQEISSASSARATNSRLII